MKYLLILIAAAGLTACSEKPQSLGTPAQDTAPSLGTGKPYTVAGWKPGDKTSWESQLKARTQYGQNDHSRSN
ncbi:MAG: hypothetical protein RIS90_2741 [Pseudomonadota bacterium]